MAETGEGSRGGKVIRHTRSGKAVYDPHQHDHRAIKKATAGAAVVGGSAVAADAARTKRVFEEAKTGIAIDRKAFSIVPPQVMLRPTTDTSMILRKNGKKAAQVWYGRHADVEDVANAKFGKRVFGVDFLYTKSEFRGQGLSKVLMKHAASDMRAQGAGSVYNQVVHPRSAALGSEKTRNRYYKESRSGLAYPTTRKEAMKNVEAWHKDFAGTKVQKISLVDSIKSLVGKPATKGIKKSNKYSAIFRETWLPKDTPSIKAFRTMGNKATIVGGALAAAAGLAYLLKGKKKQKEE